MPEVSVIIPNYNHEKYLLQRIQSVLAQAYTDFEIIILDDCSTDGSREIIEQYREHPKVAHVIYNATNSGSTFRQWEKGFKLATGKWIWIAESDDYSDPGFLSNLIALASGSDNPGIICCSSFWVDDKGNTGADLSIYKTSFFRYGYDEVKELVKHCTIQNASSCIINRAHALESIKGLGKYTACGDWIFYTRMLQKSNLVYTNEKLNYFRWYHANISNSAKERLWTTEGIQVIKNIDFNIVKFSRLEFRSMLKHWIRKIALLPLKFRSKPLITLMYASVKYFIS